MIQSRRALWLGLGLVGLIASCGQPHNSNQCETNNDCGPSRACISGRCLSQNDTSDCEQSGDCEPESQSSNDACRSSGDCPTGMHCDLTAGTCVQCLLDEQCPVGESCMSGICSDGTTDPTEEDSPISDDDTTDTDTPPNDDPDANTGSSIPCTPESQTETGLCNDGIDNDCDGSPDDFDADCPATDCGNPADYLRTEVCNDSHPPVLGPRICETPPYSQRAAGTGELCMDSCRTRSECGPGMACFPSRLSINQHYCAPMLGESLQNTGASCAQDADCRSAVCHESVCREVCARDADCGGGDHICRAVIRTPSYLGQEVATGICVPRDPNLLAVGAVCSSGATCQTGSCAQAYINGAHVCAKICGSSNDCGATERCAPGIYDNGALTGFGLRSCGEGPAAAFARVGEYCTQPADCFSNFCDGSYYHADGSPYLLAPTCTGHCDQDSDCPLLTPGSGPYDFNLQMRCMIGTSDAIMPLLGGYCAPWWCNANTDCGDGRACMIFNQQGLDGLPQGICR